MNRQGDFEGAANFFTRYRPHIIFVWSAAGCQISTTVPSLEKTIAIFWRAAKNFLLHLLCTNKEGLLASWKDRDPGSTSTDLAIKTIEYIRLQRPAWPYLGNADPHRLLWYVLDETALNAAWNGTLSAPTGVQVCRETGTVKAAAWYAVTTTAEQYAELHAAQSPLDELAEVAAGLAAKAAAAAEAESPADKAGLDTSKYLRNSPESPLDYSDVHAAAGGGQRTAAAAAAAESPAADYAEPPERDHSQQLSNSPHDHSDHSREAGNEAPAGGSQGTASGGGDSEAGDRAQFDRESEAGNEAGDTAAAGGGGAQVSTEDYCGLA